MSPVDDILARPELHDVLAIVKGARNAFVYGVKVRFPHALVMALLFSSADYQTRARMIFRATKQHAVNLARFVTLYKSVLLFQRLLNRGKQRSMDSFFAGLIGGYSVFGSRNPVNEQIVLYVLSRVVTSMLPREPEAIRAAASAPPAKPLPAGTLSPPGYPYPRPLPPSSKVFEVYAALTWGAVMWLFQHRRDRLQSGMVNSMQYLYLDSEVWSNWKNFIWHNK